MTGTPVTAVIFSASMSCKALPGFHLCMWTSLPPWGVSGWATQLLAVT